MLGVYPKYFNTVFTLNTYATITYVKTSSELCVYICMIFCLNSGSYPY